MLNPRGSYSFCEISIFISGVNLVQNETHHCCVVVYGEKLTIIFPKTEQISLSLKQNNLIVDFNSHVWVKYINNLLNNFLAYDVLFFLH